METAELETQVYNALINNETITGLLPKGGESVFHNKTPSIFSEYPAVVISVISDVPILHGDNKERLHRVLIRIHIIIEEAATAEEDNAFTALYVEIKNQLQDLGFTRYQSRPLITEGKRIMVADFKRII